MSEPLYRKEWRVGGVPWEEGSGTLEAAVEFDRASEADDDTFVLAVEDPPKRAEGPRMADHDPEAIPGRAVALLDRDEALALAWHIIGALLP